MRNAWKYFWLTCVGFLAVGILLCIIAIAMGFRWYSTDAIFNRHSFLEDSGIGLFDIEDWEVIGSDRGEDNREEYSDINSIQIDGELNKIEILPTEGEKIIVENQGLHRKSKFKVFGESGELTIQCTVPARWSIIPALKNRIQKNGNIKVYVPKDKTLSDLSISLDAGQVLINGIKTLDFSMDVDAGEAKSEDMKVRTAELNCDVGRIEFSGEITEELYIYCNVGEVEAGLFGNEEDFNYEIEAGIGEVVFGGKKVSGFGQELSGIGKLSKNIEISCDMGSVNVSFNPSKTEK